MKGRNSSDVDVGKDGPSSASKSSAIMGSILGVRKAINKFK